MKADIRMVSVGTVFHDNKPAHDCSRVTLVEDKSSLNYCSRCGDWFKPVIRLREVSNA